MDKKTILAFVLIGMLLIFTQTDFYREEILKLPPKSEMPQAVTDTTVQQDSIKQQVEEKEEPQTVVSKTEQGTIQGREEMVYDDTENDQNQFLKIIESTKKENVEDVVVETDKYIAHLSPRGAVVSNWKLKNFDYTKNKNVQLIQDDGYGNLGIFFVNDEDTIYTYDAVFKPDKNIVRFEGNKDQETIHFVLDLGEGRKFIKQFTFYKDQYIIDLTVQINQMGHHFDNNEYYLSWESGLKYTELDYSNHISKEDIDQSKAYVYQGGTKEELKLPNKPFQKESRSDFSGTVDWTAIRTKYFAMIIIPETDHEVQPILYGETFPLYKDKDLEDRVKKKLSVRFKNKILPGSGQNTVTQDFRVYIGPMDYFILKEYHPTLSKIMDFGWTLFRPFAKLVLRVFRFLNSFIPNYGFVLVIFAVLIKVMVWPLTRKSYASMQRMQSLQPKLNELKEKYGKEPQRLNKETMKMYKEEGVNPVSGCLPQLIQMPLLISIFIVFRNTIELRGAEFIFWIKDLSAPDTIFQLPFSIPFYGDLVNVLPIVMAGTMFWQQKMTMKDPKQKAMVYFMPLFFMLLFNSFPSGLNLYYTLFNIFTIIQQKWAPEKKEVNKEASANKKAPPPVKKLKNKNSKSKRK